ncbi:Sir2 family NAD-dependent protein deacetylase [Streptomyces sp. FXJ1.172]|uniref:Sir2 family NAD-dependent protein deacetylase n=1 Tax=Streptomyces sp. FXJ1.172 TaxID=710705 RepID=UPI0007CF8F79|nr:Sir2 family NAD-dependent protein deacetylase [Streptomyces sp. FXJ1.172]WEO94382.1 hypothetical protein A6P39_010405 [Streptomyces sp. FXJ1.172]
MSSPLVAILSGAGISTDSGIPDYRGPSGLWRQDPEAEKLVTYEYYMSDPQIRRRSWQMRRKNHTLHVHPAAGLAGLAVDHGARLTIVNAQPTPYDDLAEEVVREPIGTALPEVLRRLG